MKTKLVHIGASTAVRIPKSFIKRAGINGSVEMKVHGNSIILRSKKPRAGWVEALSTPSPGMAGRKWTTNFSTPRFLMTRTCRHGDPSI